MSSLSSVTTSRLACAAGSPPTVAYPTAISTTADDAEPPPLVCVLPLAARVMADASIAPPSLLAWLPSHHKLHSISVGVYDADQQLVRLAVVRGRVITHMGLHRAGVKYLFIEEALYLMELGVLEVLYDDVPLTVQEGYALLSSCEWHREAAANASTSPPAPPALQHRLHSPALCTPLDSYIAYSHAKQLGYLTLRPAALHRLPQPHTASATADVSDTTSMSAALPDEVGVVPQPQPVVFAPPVLLLSHPPLSTAAPGADRWGADESAVYSRLQSQFATPAPWPAPPTAAVQDVAALQGDALADAAVDVYLLWNPAPQQPFKRTQPPCPDCIFLINRSHTHAPHRANPGFLTPAMYEASPSNDCALTCGSHSPLLPSFPRCSPSSPIADLRRRALSARWGSAVSTYLATFFSTSTLHGRFSFPSIPILLATVHLTRVSTLCISPTTTSTGG